MLPFYFFEGAFQIYFFLFRTLQQYDTFGLVFSHFFGKFSILLNFLFSLILAKLQ